jgi:hypothetical protein
MADGSARLAKPELLHYRPWSPAHATDSGVALGEGAAWRATWAIARTSLGQMFRRWLFWGLYGMALLVFLVFFIGQYLMAWAQTQLTETNVRVGGFGRTNPRDLVGFFRTVLKLDGSGETYRNLFWYEGYTVMVVLAMAGSILIGNDLRQGSLTFYLSKPISRWHYLLGKGLAVAVFVNLMTTLPALVLFFEFGFLEPGDGFAESDRLISFLPAYTLSVAGLLGLIGLALWRMKHARFPLWVVGLPALAPLLEILVLGTGDYFRDQAHLALGILGYGLILSVTLTLVLLATATWVQRTVPLILTWTTLFIFCRVFANALVEGLKFDPRWRLIDLWNSTYLVGNVCLSINPSEVRPFPQPPWHEAAFVLIGVCTLCLSYLIQRIRAVEVVR